MDWYYKIKCPICDETTDFAARKKPDHFHTVVRLVTCKKCHSEMKCLVGKDKRAGADPRAVVIEIGTIKLSPVGAELMQQRIQASIKEKSDAKTR